MPIIIFSEAMPLWRDILLLRHVRVWSRYQESGSMWGLIYILLYYTISHRPQHPWILILPHSRSSIMWIILRVSILFIELFTYNLYNRFCKRAVISMTIYLIGYLLLIVKNRNAKMQIWNTDICEPPLHIMIHLKTRNLLSWLLLDRLGGHIAPLVSDSRDTNCSLISHSAPSLADTRSLLGAE